jgi:hypothetical protein
MPQPNDTPHYFTDEDTPLPMHMLFIEQMPLPKYACRSYSSSAARAAQYECFNFYKHISRVVPAELSQEGEK